MKLFFLFFCTLIACSVFAAEPAAPAAPTAPATTGTGRPDDMLTEAQVQDFLGVNNKTVKLWIAQGYLKPFGSAAQMFFKRANVEEVKKLYVDTQKKTADASTNQVNDRNFGRDQTAADRDAQRQKEQAARGAGATADQRVGSDNKTDYRASELEARRKEADAARNNRSGSVTDDRQAERDRAARDRANEQNGKRL